MKVGDYLIIGGLSSIGTGLSKEFGLTNSISFATGIPSKKFDGLSLDISPADICVLIIFLVCSLVGLNIFKK